MNDRAARIATALVASALEIARLRRKVRRLSPARTTKASSAESILRICLSRRGWTRAFREAELTGAQHLDLLDDVRQYGRSWLHHEAEGLFRHHGRSIDGSAVSGRHVTGDMESRLERGTGQAIERVDQPETEDRGGRATGEDPRDGALIDAGHGDRAGDDPGWSPGVPGDAGDSLLGERGEGRLEATEGASAVLLGHDVLLRSIGAIGQDGELIDARDGVVRGRDAGGNTDTNSRDFSAKVDGIAEDKLAGEQEGTARDAGLLLEASILLRSIGSAARHHVARFFDRAKGFVRELIVAGAMALGGPSPLTATDLRAVDAEVAVQHQYFDRFHTEVIENPPEELQEPSAPPPPIPGLVTPIPIPSGEALKSPMTASQFAARAESYGNAGWTGPQNALRARPQPNGTVERRVHTREEPHAECATCIEQTAMGWQPIGLLLPIGDGICLGNCDCAFQRLGPDGVIRWLNGKAAA